MQGKITDLKSYMSSVPGNIQSETRSHISQLTGGGTIMGGQNKQAQRK